MPQFEPPPRVGGRNAFPSSTPDLLHAQITRGTNQTVANNTSTAISWSTADYELGADFWDAATPTRILIPSTGLYYFTTTPAWVANSTNIREVKIRVNGGTAFHASLTYPALNAVFGVTKTPADALARLNAGDYLETLVFQNSGGNLDLSAADGLAFSIVRLSD